MTIIPRKSLLIATLGTEPQVVTTGLELLNRQGETIEKVVILHTITADLKMTQALKTLQNAFEENARWKRFKLELLPICTQSGQELIDLNSPEAAQTFFRFVYRQMREYKQVGYNIHFLIAGGRKTMALFGMVIAQLLFDNTDRLWYLYSNDAYLKSKRLYPSAQDQARLLPIPVLLWNDVSPAFVELSDIQDPFEAAEHFRALRLQEQREKIQGFIWGLLTGREREVVELLAKEGISDIEIGQRLRLSHRTVEQHLSSARSKAANHWERANITRAQLITLLNRYYTFPQNYSEK